MLKDTTHDVMRPRPAPGDAPRLLPALVMVAVLIVLAGLASLHVSALTPPGAALEQVLR